MPPRCGEWNSIVEEAVQPVKKSGRTWVSRSKPVPITEVENSAETKFSSGIPPELDRVLGGVWCPGA